MDKTRLLIVCLTVLGLSRGCDGLLCHCTTSRCEKNGNLCETTGACLASASLIDNQEQHVRLCIDKEKLVPPGQPFFCQSVKGLLTSHCCYTDYCNSLDLKVYPDNDGAYRTKEVLATPPPGFTGEFGFQLREKGPRMEKPAAEDSTQDVPG